MNKPELVDRTDTTVGNLLDALEEAFGVIANAYGGDWSKATPMWRERAEAVRDHYLELLGTLPPSDPRVIR